MACKLIDIMSATADELAEIEGIDSGMAFTIVEIISQNHFIDLHTVSRITGMRRKALKEQFIEPIPLDVWKSMLHDYENKTAANIAEASEQIASVQERIRGVKENVGDFTSRLVKVEQSMLMGSTIQFKDPDLVEKFNKESTSMKDGQDEMKTMENQIDNLIKTKNAKAEKKLGTGKAKAITPLTRGDSLFPELVESPIAFPKTTVIENPKTPQTDAKSSGDQFASAKSSLDIGDRPINPTVDKMQGPMPPTLLTNLLDSN